MKRAVLVITVLLGVQALAYDDSELSKARERVEEVAKKAKGIMDHFEQAKGCGLRDELDQKLRNRESNKSANDALNDMLGKVLGKLKDAKAQSQEASGDVIYEACWVFMKYLDEIDNEHMVFPSWLTDAFKEEDGRSYSAIIGMLTDAEKRMFDSPKVVTVVSKKE